jgi:dTDP-4-dehydrorhamnose reductase
MTRETDSILITGGGGMLAQALGAALRRRGKSPTLLSHQQLDVTDPAAVGRAFEEHRPAYAFNCAAHTKVDQCETEPQRADAINGHAVATLAKAARDHGTQLVHFSTDFVFDGRGSRPYRPTDPTAPLSAYGRSKLLGERMLREVNPPRWMIVRTAWLYGRGGPNFVRTMVNAARAGKPLTVVNDQVGAPTWTMDLAEATIELIERDASGIFHVTNADQTTWYDFAAAIFEAFGLRPELAPITSAQWKATRPDSATRPAYSVLDLGETQRLLGRPMRHWRDALLAFKHEIDSSGGF